MHRNVSYSHTPIVMNTGSTHQPDGLYVAIGLEEEDAGYPVIVQATDTLGDGTLLAPSLWYVKTKHTLDEAFLHMNTSMLDRRIDGHTSLVVLDPYAKHAKWHLRQPLSDLLCAHWHFEHNVFIAFTLRDPKRRQNRLVQCITGLGVWAPISRTMWYLSTTCSSKDVFQRLLSAVEEGDHLCVFDSAGNVATWQEGIHLAAATMQ